MSFNIAIDGPAGAGKSTIAKALAGELGFVYVDTGALYRALAYAVLQAGADPENEAAVAEVCRDVSVSLFWQEGKQRVRLNGEDITGHLRDEAVGNMASVTSVYPSVREKLLSIQQDVAKQENVIMDGRDIGTCVLPDAQCKIYLTASVDTRAQRRFDELSARGEQCDLEQIKEDIKSRDERDMSRPIAPLKQADDAVLVDSSELTIAEVTAVIRAEAEKKMAEA